jgi:hypothetical protein
MDMKDSLSIDGRVSKVQSVGSIVLQDPWVDRILGSITRRASRNLVDDAEIRKLGQGLAPTV